MARLTMPRRTGPWAGWRCAAVVTLLAALALTPGARAQSPGGADGGHDISARRTILSAADKRDVARVQAYLNGITTMVSNFVQIAPNGGIARGRLYVSRPGKMRVEYDPPVKILMVATGIFFIFWDGELKETTYLPQRSTPLSLLLKKRIDLMKDARVTAVSRRDGVLRLTLVPDAGEAGTGGSLTLTFRNRPLALKQWTLRNPQGQVTRLALLDPRFGVPIPARKFKYIAPVGSQSNR